MTRSERRDLARSLAAEYGVPMRLAFRAIQKDVVHRCIALSTGEADPPKAFLAAAQTLTAEQKR